MGPAEIIAIIAVVLIIGGALAYIIKAKRSGQKCIGCPYSKQCASGKGSCSCGCSNQKDEENE